MYIYVNYVYYTVSKERHTKLMEDVKVISQKVHRGLKRKYSQY